MTTLHDSADDQIEQDLARRAATGDARAASDLWRRCHRWLAGCLVAHRPAGADVDDLLQETALKMWRHIGDLREPARLRPWLRTIAVHVARSAGRRDRSRPRTAGIAGTGDEAPAPYLRAIRDRQLHREALGEVLDLVEELPADQREVLLLRAVEGLSQKAIAALVEVPETTVETRLARARRTLRARHAARREAVETHQTHRPIRALPGSRRTRGAS